MDSRSVNWLKVTCRHPPAAAEALSAALFDEGARAIWEEQPDRLGRMVSTAALAPARQAALGLALPPLMARLAEIFECSPADFEFSLDLEEDHDWAEKWKEGLRPIPVSARLALAPSWWPADDLPPGETVLRLDPGLAFGSGHHATTYLCLQLLDELAPGAGRILDVGAGSGVLSLAAAVLSPRAEVVGVDNDPETIAVAVANALANGLEGRVSFSGRALAELRPPFGLIAANITLLPLTELAPAISALAAEDGRLILSGLLEAQAGEAAAFYGRFGWRPVRRLLRDEWAALLLSRAGV